MHIITANYLRPAEPIKVVVVGVGGTGSHVLPILAKVNYDLIANGHIGLNVIAFDDDCIGTENIGRQNFSPFQVGEFKCEAIITAINRYYGFTWRAICDKFDVDYAAKTSIGDGIVISCVDNFHARKLIHETLFTKFACYWIDCGNTYAAGQIIVGHNDREKSRRLPSVIEEFPDMEKIANEADLRKENCNAPAQGLLTNLIMATYAVSIVSGMFKNMFLRSRGIYINIGEELNINEIPLDYVRTRKRNRKSAVLEAGNSELPPVR